MSEIQAMRNRLNEIRPRIYELRRLARMPARYTVRMKYGAEYSELILEETRLIDTIFKLLNP